VTIHTAPYDTLKFVVNWLPGEDFPDGWKFNVATMADQVEYIKMQVKKGKVFAAGPFEDETGAMTIFNVDNEIEMREIIANNPAVIKKIVKAEYRAWRPVKWHELD
jgi:uncharacterized protein